MEKSVAIIVSQHGNEPLGGMLEEYFKQKQISEKDITFITANPQALQQNVRYIESDMNRSFDRNDTHEGRQAQKLKELLWRFAA